MTRLRFQLLTALLLLGGGGTLWLWHHRRAAPPPLAAIEVQGETAEGLRFLLSDMIEVQNRWILLQPTPGIASAQGVHGLRVQSTRQGEALDLNAALDGQALPRIDGDPAKALTALAGDLSMPAPGPVLVPENPAVFWELVDLLGKDHTEPDSVLVDRAEALVRAQPRCASARMALADLLARYLVAHQEADTLEIQAHCEQNFRDGLALCPNHPRLTAAFAIYLTDIGRQREALQFISDGLSAHPGSPTLLNALAYAARTGGLLDLANRALNRRATITGLPRGQTNLADNTLLYLGKLDAFEADLARMNPGPIRSFYAGYARLLRKDEAGARAIFQAAPSSGVGSVLFVQLSKVYRLELEGHRDQALQALDALESSRVQIHLPDGEFTFKLAEAYGYLDQAGRALDLEERAAVQGFGCADWYERAPFLAEARHLPRWTGLDLRLRERQRLLAQAWPPSAFGL